MDPNRVKVSASSCLGVCMGGPILAVYPDGVWYHHVDKALIDRIIEEHLRNNHPVLEWAFYVRDGDARRSRQSGFRQDRCLTKGTNPPERAARLRHGFVYEKNPVSDRDRVVPLVSRVAVRTRYASSSGRRKVRRTTSVPPLVASLVAA